MPYRKRQHLKTIEEQEIPNKLINQLSSNDYILDPPSTGLEKFLPKYEVIEEAIRKVQDIYEENVLDCYEETHKMLKQQQEELTKFVEKLEVKIPKTLNGGKNVSALDKTHETIVAQKDRMTMKNLFVNSYMSGDDILTFKPGLDGGLRSKITKPPGVNVGLNKNTKREREEKFLQINGVKSFITLRKHQRHQMAK